MSFKVIFFTVCCIVPLIVWYFLANKRGDKVEIRLLISCFIFGSWFGMFGELFLYRVIDLIWHQPIWEYRTMPIHHKITSAYGPIMWGLSSVYICFHHHYNLVKISNLHWAMRIFYEALFLLVLEVLFNFLAYGIFKEYFFYYFVPDLWHWTSLTNLPFWWAGYKMIMKVGKILNHQEKLNLALATVMLVVAFFPD